MLCKATTKKLRLWGAVTCIKCRRNKKVNEDTKMCECVICVNAFGNKKRKTSAGADAFGELADFSASRGRKSGELAPSRFIDFLDAVVVAPSVEDHRDGRGLDGLAFSGTELDQVGGGEVLRQERQ